MLSSPCSTPGGGNIPVPPVISNSKTFLGIPPVALAIPCARVRIPLTHVYIGWFNAPATIDCQRNDMRSAPKREARSAYRG